MFFAEIKIHSTGLGLLITYVLCYNVDIEDNKQLNINLTEMLCHKLKQTVHACKISNVAETSSAKKSIVDN